MKTDLKISRSKSRARTATAPGNSDIRSLREPNSASYNHGDHFVQFYETDSGLVQSLAQYLIPGLQGVDACIVVATASHLKSLRSVLEDRGWDLDALTRSGKYLALDAATTLQKFLINGVPNPERFEEVVGTLVERVMLANGTVRIFGELVGLLSAEQKYEEAIALENMWNALQKRFRFQLF